MADTLPIRQSKNSSVSAVRNLAHERSLKRLVTSLPCKVRRGHGLLHAEAAVDGLHLRRGSTKTIGTRVRIVSVHFGNAKVWS